MMASSLPGRVPSREFNVLTVRSGSHPSPGEQWISDWNNPIWVRITRLRIRCSQRFQLSSEVHIWTHCSFDWFNTCGPPKRSQAPVWVPPPPLGGFTRGRRGWKEKSDSVKPESGESEQNRVTSMKPEKPYLILRDCELPRPCGRPPSRFPASWTTLPLWPGVEDPTGSTVPALKMCSRSTRAHERAEAYLGNPHLNRGASAMVYPGSDYY